LDFALITFDIQKEIEALDVIIQSRKNAAIVENNKPSNRHSIYGVSPTKKRANSPQILETTPDKAIVDCEVIQKVKNFKSKVDLASKLLKAEGALDVSSLSSLTLPPPSLPPSLSISFPLSLHSLHSPHHHHLSPSILLTSLSLKIVPGSGNHQATWKHCGTHERNDSILFK
jgi:hypothetical protein